MPLTNNVLFDKGGNFFDNAIFDTTNHYIMDAITETVSTGEVIAGGISYLRNINEGAVTMFDPGITPFYLFDPAIFDTNTNNTLSITDDVERLTSQFRAINEPSISDSESLTGTLIVNRNITETYTLIDVLTGIRILIRNIFEPNGGMFDVSIFDSAIFDTKIITAPYTDNITGTQSLFRSISETITISDALAGIQNLIRNITETTINVLDSIDRTASYIRALPETYSDTDSIDRTLISFRAISEPSISVSDNLTRNIIYGRILNEIILISDILTGTLPIGRIKFTSRIKESLDLISRLREALNITSRVI